MNRSILALDQGTTSSRAILFDEDCNVIATAQKEFKQYYPSAGYVEHDALEIWESQKEAALQVIQQSSMKTTQITAIGIANQRETAVLWDRKTGIPICPAIVWQDRRTAPQVEDFKNRNHEPLFTERTGLVLDAYFSATKIMWMLDTIPSARRRAEKGDLAFGTIDSWLLWNLTKGRIHATDYTNASRTLLFNIHTLQWDEELLNICKIPKTLLPHVYPSSYLYGYTDPLVFHDLLLPIAGISGDQHAALFGQGCFLEGEGKVTYGTGSFLLVNTGSKPKQSQHKLLTTPAWGINEKVTYALEGSVFISGALIQWLRDELGIIEAASDIEVLARTVPDSNGITIVPAFTGLGAPYWCQEARGAILGITRGTTKAHIARAALEAICFQIADLVAAMSDDTSQTIKKLLVDGGAAQNNLLLQLQADILGIQIICPLEVEATSRGAAFLAGLHVKIWDSLDTLKKIKREEKVFTPLISLEEREKRLNHWKNTIKRIVYS
jgi:glycerol kinase